MLEVLKLIHRFKNLMFFIHQNFLLNCQLVLGRLPAESSNNIWAHSLLAQVLNKKAFELGKDLTKSSFHRVSTAKKIDDYEIEFKYVLPLL